MLTGQSRLCQLLHPWLLAKLSYVFQLLCSCLQCSRQQPVQWRPQLLPLLAGEFLQLLGCFCWQGGPVGVVPVAVYKAPSCPVENAVGHVGAGVAL